MSYVDQKMSGGKIGAIVIVALIHALLGYAFVTGLAYQYVKKAAQDMDVFDVEEPPPPPPDEPPPPPPDQPMQPPPVVAPPAIVQVPQPPIMMQTVQTPPPSIVMTPVVAPPAPPAPPPRVSQAASMSIGNIQRLFGDPANYPDDALNAGAQGLVVASLQIDGRGTVTGCSVTTSSRNSSLDSQTCRLFKRIKASPARDADGNGVASTTSLRFRWVLPAE
ncbi:MAG: TonB family protein [Pseudomonadota bacterium]